MSGASLECDMELSSQEELLEARETTSRVGGNRRRTFTLMAGLLVMGAAIALWYNPSAMAQVKGRFFMGLDEEVGADAEVGCEELPFVKIVKVISSNLGKKGPDKDAEEGIIYEVAPHHTGLEDEDNRSFQIHVHSLNAFDVSDEEELENYDKDYEPAFTSGEYVNGIHGKFACINVKQNESVKLRAHAYDADKKKDVPLPHSAMSFFDLDTGAEGTHSVEHVSVRGFKTYFLSNETEVNVTTDGDRTVFTATTEGTGSDNPKNPIELTEQQKNRAVTIEFEGKDKLDFEIGASAGKTGRVFSFVLRPSLLCAQTKLPDGSLVPATGASAPIIPVEGAAHKDLPSAVWVFGFLSAFLSSFM